MNTRNRVRCRRAAARRRASIGAALATASMLAAAPAAAGPWTLPQGDTQIFIGAEFRRAPARFDAEGAPTSGERFSGVGGLVVERGLRDWATLGLKAEAEAVLLDTDGADGAGFGETERSVWGRVRLWDGDWGVASVQAGYAMGATDARAASGLDFAARADAVEGRALVGRGWGWGPAIGWLGAEAAYRFRNRGASDQLRLDLTAGARPRAAQRYLGFVQLFATRSIGRGERDDFDLLKLSGSLGYEVTDNLTLVGGAIHELEGRNVELGDSATLSIWIRY